MARLGQSGLEMMVIRFPLIYCDDAFLFFFFVSILNIHYSHFLFWIVWFLSLTSRFKGFIFFHLSISVHEINDAIFLCIILASKILNCN